MSYWTHINGTVTVSPYGRTQAEKKYILETVLDHLPRVSGSEKDMDIYIIQKNGFDGSSSHTEFGEWGGYKKWKTLSTNVQSEYILVVNGDLRDKKFEETYREFQKWICRLAKRVDVKDVLVEIKDYNKASVITNPYLMKQKSYDTVYGQMHENPTWFKDKNSTGEPNWCEYLMWDSMKNCDYPMLLGYKYFNDEENDAEVERRQQYMESTNNKD